MSLTSIINYLKAQVQTEIVLFLSAIGLGMLLLAVKKLKYESIIEKFLMRKSIGVNKAFDILLGETGADRIYILEFDGEHINKTNPDLMVHCLNEVLREGTFSALEKRNRSKVGRFGTLYEKLWDEKILLINNTYGLDNFFMRAFFTSFNTNSACMHLVYDFNSNNPIAILCFDFVRQHIDFTKETHIATALKHAADKISFVYKT